MKTEIPKAWCESCSAELKPFEVLLGRCPHCREPITRLVVDIARRPKRLSGRLQNPVEQLVDVLVAGELVEGQARDFPTSHQ